MLNTDTSEPLVTALREHLRALVLKTGLTREEVSVAMGEDRGFLERVERDPSLLMLSHYIAMAEALNGNATEMMRDYEQLYRVEKVKQRSFNRAGPAF